VPWAGWSRPMNARWNNRQLPCGLGYARLDSRELDDEFLDVDTDRRRGWRAISFGSGERTICCSQWTA